MSPRTLHLLDDAQLVTFANEQTTLSELEFELAKRLGDDTGERKGELQNMQADCDAMEAKLATAERKIEELEARISAKEKAQ